MVRSFFVAVLVASSFLFACSGSDGDGNSSGGNTNGGTSGSSGNNKTGGSSGKTGGSSGETTETEEPGGENTSGGTPTTSKKAYGSQCKESAECESDFCVFQGGSIGMCTQTCEDTIDCPGLGQKCVKVSDAPQKVCVPE